MGTRLAELWLALDAREAGDFIARIDALAAERPPGSAIGLFERGAARDSTGPPTPRCRCTAPRSPRA